MSYFAITFMWTLTMSSDLYHLVYLSKATDQFSEDEDLRDILQTSRTNNQQRDISGMLLYSDGGFIQALEGPKSAVMDLYETIEEDPRHAHTVMLASGTLDERNFPEWKMGFESIDMTTKQLPGFSRFLEQPSPETAQRQELAYPVKLLLSFKDGSDG